MSETSEMRLTIEEAMARLSLSRAEVYRRVKDGKLKAEKIDHRASFLEADVAQYAEVLEEERESLQSKVAHGLSVFAERLGAQGHTEINEVAESPVPDQVAELGRRIMSDCLLAGIQDLYLDPLHEGDRLIYNALGQRSEPARFETVLSGPLKDWFKSQVTFPETETPGIREAPGQQTYMEQPCRFRMTVVPTLLGEHIHIHFFPDYGEISVETLGYTPEQADAVQSMLRGRPGLALIAGAVDPSAEQHRLALAHALSAEGRLVVSLEHHVQYRSDSLVQLDIGQKDGVGFNALWQTVLNMRPDVIFFDECRDKDEARALIEGVYSGAVVVAKVRAANAIDAITQLITFEVNRVNLAQVLVGVIERLVLRKASDAGQTTRPASEREAALLHVGEGTGIPDCTIIDPGHQERRVVFGIWPANEAMSDWIRNPEAPVPCQTEPVSLAQAIRQAVLDGEVTFGDAAPYLMSEELPESYAG